MIFVIGYLGDWSIAGVISREDYVRFWCASSSTTSMTSSRPKRRASQPAATTHSTKQGQGNGPADRLTVQSRDEEPQRSAPTNRSNRRDSSDDNSSSSADDDVAKRRSVQSSVEAMLALLHSVHPSTSDRLDPSSQQSSTEKEVQAKKRKTTHSIRKGEITLLTNEKETLEKRLAFLRGQELQHATRQAQSKTSDGHVQDPEHPYIPNSLLREAVHEQQMNLACARSMISQFLEGEDTSPIHCYLHLPKLKTKREQIMRVMKPYQIRTARRYMLQRSQHLNVFKPHSSGERFVNRNGDAVNIRFSMVQFPGSLTVRQVFEAASFYTSNLEISYTDGAGRVTIREHEDAIDEPTMSQHHFLTEVHDGLQMEGNLVMLSHLDEEEDYGICTSTYVDRDDLYPYHPSERIRQDITAVFMVSREKDTIVMRRMAHVRVRYTDTLPGTDDLLLSLSEGVSYWGEAMTQHARHKVGLQHHKCRTALFL